MFKKKVLNKTISYEIFVSQSALLIIMVKIVQAFINFIRFKTFLYMCLTFSVDAYFSDCKTLRVKIPLDFIHLFNEIIYEKRFYEIEIFPLMETSHYC